MLAEGRIIVSPDNKLTAQLVSFDDLARWPLDRHSAALATFRRSCGVMRKTSQTKIRPGFTGTYADWARVCARAGRVTASSHPAVRLFFEYNFVPVQLLSGADKALFTGYFEPELAASLKPSKTYNTPLYRKPKDLQRGNKAYFTRAEIEKGALKNRKLEFVYLKNSVDAFFLHIQGSGRLFLDNGKTMRVGFAAKNGRPYTAIGKVLIENNHIARNNMSMQSIRTWLLKNPRRAQNIMHQNQSFIFFRPLKNSNPNLGPPGAQTVQLTPKRSLAIDKTLHGYGLPMWLETEIPDPEKGKSTPFHHLMVAQDTGTAIKGPVRGDIYWGSGKAAGNIAGRMKQPGRLYLLLPKRLVAKYML